ncbi:MAG TPA: DUF349 domain-containing protein [Porphyromonadaceae bacterium]|jgi:transcriptional regulator of heat shock response|nr:DUF349 domain-containing protein [Porphyromonadaceae bacterium]HCM22224.1 DUF349 domain-containing protein [Porphyromonadaceae bacterium]
MNTNDNLENEKLPVDNSNVEDKDIRSTTPAENQSQEQLHSESTPEADNTDTHTTDDSSEVEVPAQPVVREDEDTVTGQGEGPEAPENAVIDYDLELHEQIEEDEEDAVEGAAAPTTDLSTLTVEEIVQKLRDLLASDAPERREVDEYKTQFFQRLRLETERQKAAFLADGGDEIDFIANETPIYSEGKELISEIKEKRARLFAEQEAEKEHNVEKKQLIIEKIKALTENQTGEDFNKVYQEFKDLQQQWNEIKLLPHAKVNELWKSYQYYVEKFYDLVRINNEFREYDFKKNYELKSELCEAAERLEEEPDVISAFHQLQKFHQEWREIGPVAMKDREIIWDRFKEASTVINKKYQQYFEDLKANENENLEKKTALCEKLEAIDYDKIKTFKDWKNKIKEVLDLQEEWRKIGQAPRKQNAKIFRRYRAACDFFFRNKNEFFRSMHDEMEENLQKKVALCERAEALKDSTDWQNTTQQMIDIQKEWKTIGIVPPKQSKITWERFRAACDYFFEQKKKQYSSRHDEEAKNLEEKRRIVKEIQSVDPAMGKDEGVKVVRKLMDEWYQIGFVPFKLKDKVYDELNAAVDAQFARLGVEKVDRELETFRLNVSDMAKAPHPQKQLFRERDRLMRQYERKKAELQTYENNIGFLSVSSKKGNNLIDNMHQKVDAIKSDIDLLIKKIEEIDKEI